MPRPVPTPMGLVVKNGSNTRARVLASMPMPVSLSATLTYDPGSTQACNGRSAAPRRVRRTSTCSVPPFGMASRALLTRCRTICFTAAGSTSTTPGSSSASNCTSMLAGSWRRNASSASRTNSARISGCSSSTPCRLKPSSRCARSAPAIGSLIVRPGGGVNPVNSSMPFEPLPLPLPLKRQRLAIEAPLGPVLVIAGPGAGKTYCLIARIDHLIHRHSMPPERLCAVTFTNRAAEEIAARLQHTLGERAETITRGTIHALCLALLREHTEAAGRQKGFGVADEEYQTVILGRQHVPLD